MIAALQHEAGSYAEHSRRVLQRLPEIQSLAQLSGGSLPQWREWGRGDAVLALRQNYSRGGVESRHARKVVGFGRTQGSPFHETARRPHHLRRSQGTVGVAPGPREAFAARVLCRPRSRQLSSLDSPQAAGAGCNSFRSVVRASSSRFLPPLRLLRHPEARKLDGRGDSTQSRGRPLSARSRGGGVQSSFVNALSGQASCVLFTRSASRKRRQSNAPSCRAMHVCAVGEISARRGRGYFLTRPPKNWQRAPARPCGQPLMKYQASASRQQNHLLRSSWLAPNNPHCTRQHRRFSN